MFWPEEVTVFAVLVVMVCALAGGGAAMMPQAMMETPQSKVFCNEDAPDFGARHVFII